MARLADPLKGFETDLETQRRYLADQVAAYGRLLELLPQALAGAPRERLAAVWAKREFGAFYERPLLLLASLRDEALREGPGHPLWTAVGTDQPSPGDLTQAALATAFESDRVWELLATRHIQTNETSRAVAWLWPAALLAKAVPGTSLELYDLGASAGLNLVADRLAAIWEDGRGKRLPVSPTPEIAGRRGFDLRPVNALDPDTERWLRACIWPGQNERLARFDQAIATLRELAATGDAPEIEELAAVEIPVALRHDGDHVKLAYQTVVRDYLTPDDRAAYETGMLSWLAGSSPGRAIWIQLELEGGVEVAKPFGLTARIAGTEEVFMLARCDPHPRILVVDDEQVARFLRAAA